MKMRLIGLALAGLAAAQSPAGQPAPDAYRGWAAYGGGPEQIRYSSLAQITPRNVAQLEVAWTFDSGEAGDLQTQPVVVNGLLYAYTPGQKVLALDAATGRAVWTFDARLQGRGPIRGIMRWGDPPPRQGASSRQSTNTSTRSTRRLARRSRRSATPAASICGSISAVRPRGNPCA